MATLQYANFDLTVVERDGRFTVRVVDSPAGHAEGQLDLPFSPDALENFILKMGHNRTVRRGMGPSRSETAQVFGDRLYRTVFTSEIETCFRRSLDEAARTGRGLRVRVGADQAPSLADIPWEYLFSPSLDRFVALSLDTPIVRSVDHTERVTPLIVQPPLRILAMVASPSDLEPLDVEREIGVILEATSGLVADGRVDVTVHRDGDLTGLQRRLRQQPFHIFHFVGHGGFDALRGDGMLWMTGSQGRGRPVPARELGVMLHDHDPLRLAVLNACEGARSGVENPLGGVAQSLVRQGIPAALAMQFEISDAAAIAFAHEFYLALADGFPIDAATVEGRKAILAAGNDVEWGTPVLYLRTGDGVLFDISGETARTAAPPPVAPAETIPPRRVQWAAWLAALAVVLVAGVAWLAWPDGSTTDTTLAPVGPGVAVPDTTSSATTAQATTRPAEPTTSPTGNDGFTVGVPSILPPDVTAENGASGSGCLDDVDRVPDGIWFGSIVETPRSDSLVFDPACFFWGDAAFAAGAEDGIDAININNDYYIRDDSVATRTILVSERAAVYFRPDGEVGFEIVPFVAWSGNTGLQGCPGDGCLAWLYVNDGEVTEIMLQWIP